MDMPQKVKNKLEAFDRKLETMEMAYLNGFKTKEEYEKERETYLNEIVIPYKKRNGLE